MHTQWHQAVKTILLCVALYVCVVWCSLFAFSLTHSFHVVVMISGEEQGGPSPSTPSSSRWAVVRDVFGATPNERFRLLRHEERRQQRQEAAAAGVAGQDTVPSAPVHRDHGYFNVLRHFRSTGTAFVDLEFYFAVTCLGLADELLGTMLLPFKAVVCWSRLECRDVVALAMLFFCTLSYYVCGWYTTQLYAYLYHAVRRTSFIKLVMVFNILDVADKVLSSFSQDALEVLFACVQQRWPLSADTASSVPAPTTQKPYRPEAATAHLPSSSSTSPSSSLATSRSVVGVDRVADSDVVLEADRGDVVQPMKARWRRTGHVLLPSPLLTSTTTHTRKALPECSPNSEQPHPVPRYSVWLLVGSGLAAAVGVTLHSLVLLLSCVTLHVGINAEGTTLLTLLVSNNFAELKSTVFKKYTPESLHSICAVDALERLQFVLFVLVMLLQQLHERVNDFAAADGAIILAAEVLVDFTKHIFASRFNGIATSVFKGYGQLTLLDVATERIFWRLPRIRVHVVQDRSVTVLTAHSPGVDSSVALPALLTPSYGYAPKNIRRIGFDSVAYAAMMLWGCGRAGGYLLTHAPLVLALVMASLVLVKIVLSSLVYGVTARFVLRTIVRVPPQWPKTAATPVVGCSTADDDHSAAAGSSEMRGPPRLCHGVPVGVSPICTPRASPVSYSLQRDSAGTGDSADKGKRTAEKEEVCTVLQLTPLLCALLKVDRFDLQAGKVKKEMK